MFFTFRSSFGLLLLAFLLTGTGSKAQVTNLSFRPVDAAYSLSLDRAIFISGNPNQLHLYDVAGQADRIIGLPGVPLNLSLSSDGTHAAVAYVDSISYVDLRAGSIIRTFTGLSVGTKKVILGNGYIYAFPTYEDTIISLNLASGQTTFLPYVYASGGVFDPIVNAIYKTQDGISPNSLNRFDVAAGPIGNSTGQPSYYFGVFPVCGPLTLSLDAATIYSGCGTIFQASRDPSQDMRYLGALPGINQIQSLATSDSLKRIAVIPRVLPYLQPPVSNADTVVDLFDITSFNAVGQLATTPFSVHGSSYAAHGRWTFYNAASTALVIVTQADSSSALTQDYAIENVNLSIQNSCNAQFGGSSASVIAAGSYGSTAIVAGEGCLFTATSNVPWISLTSGYYGSGNTNLLYLVRPNSSGSARSGTISMGSQTLTITQDALAAASPLTPLSFRPVAADYDKALDKIVLVSASPNELHVYDPVSQMDQIVPLTYIPLSVSVRPDGLSAAVGHRGRISIVDLQALAVTSTIPVDMDNGGILLASNGYAYAFPTQTASWAAINSVQLSNGALTPLQDVYYGNVPRLDSSGTYVYVGGAYGGSKLNIGSGPARLQTSFLGSLGANFWLSENGSRIVTSTGAALFTSTNPAQDLSAAGNLSGSNTVSWAANAGTLAKTAVLSDPSATTNSQLQLYADNGLQLLSQISLPSFVNGTTRYASHGRYLFWNAAASKLFAIAQADSTSGLLSDFGLYEVDASASLAPCSFAVSPSVLTIPASPNNGSWFFDVQSTCSWKPVVTGNNWFYLAGSGFTTGNGRVNLTPFNNTGSARASSIQIGTQIVIVTQADASCAYQVSSKGETFTAAGGTDVVNLTTAGNCAWSVQSGVPWLAVTANSSGTGSASVQFSVAPNATGAVRVGSVNIAGNYVSITQSAAPVTPPTDFLPIAPCRVADTRNAEGPFGGPFLAANTSRTFSPTDANCNIPSAATAYSLNITVVPHGSLNYLTAWPGGGVQPFVSTLNARDGRTKANAAIIDAGANKSVSFFATDDTELVVDITGYFVGTASGTGLEFYPVAPCRVYDSRGATGPLGGPALEGGQSRDIPVLQSNCYLPTSAQAYSLNFTAVPSTSSLGWLTTWPTGEAQPLVSTLHAVTGAVTANAAILQAGAAGSIGAYVTDKSELVIDTNGYFAPHSVNGLHFHSVAPCRALDTRETLITPFQGVLAVQVGATCNVSMTALAVVLNSTVVPSQTLSYLTLWPSGGSQPLLSTLNAYDGAVTSNMAIAPLSGGMINAFATENTHLIIDVTGYFAP